MSSTHPLELKNVSMHFGGIKAVSELSFHLKKGEILALIGPNGAGKTTAFNAITGVYQPTSGAIFSGGKPLAGKRPHQITQMGLARTFQNIRLFKDLSVRENIAIALDRSATRAFIPDYFRALFRPASFWENEKKNGQEINELLQIFQLDKISDDIEAKNLPYGVQRRLEIARAIATGASTLLLDEPAAGMNGQETAKLMETLRFIRERFHLSILLIEHDMKLVMGISERIVVLEYGRMIAEGAPSDIQNNKAVIKAYLGTE